MIIPPRAFARLVCVVCIAHSAVPAQTNGIDVAASPVPPDLAAFLAFQPRWTVSAQVDTAFGYKDNLLLSATNEERSTFVRGGLEMFVLRDPRERLELSILGQTEHTRLFSGKSVDDETQVWVQSELGYRMTEVFKTSVPVTGYYYDQVFDVSDTDVERVVARFKVRGLAVGPTVRWRFHPLGWIEAQSLGERKRYDDGANDSRIAEGHARLGWQLGSRIEARVRGTRRQRDFDERVQHTAAGRALTGTELKLDEREGELRVDVEWDARRRWKSNTRMVFMSRRDNGSNYFGYDQERISHEVTWKTDRWLVRAGGAAERVEFSVQTVGISIDPPPRIEDAFTAELRIERRLTLRWTLFGGYGWERNRSNDPIASYRVNEGLLGARWSWDK